MKEFSLLEYTKNPNVVANMSSQEYFKRKSLEIGLESFPEVDFIAIPTIHKGEDRAQEILSIVKREKADILLVENVSAYSRGFKAFLRDVKENKSKRVLDFLKEISKDSKSFYSSLLSETEKMGVACDTYEHKRTTIFDVLDYLEKVKYSYKMIYALDIMEYYNSGNVELALQKLKEVMFAKGGFEEVQNEREWLMLNNIAPRVFEMVNANEKLAKKTKIKVAYFIGVAHEESFIDKMFERGDNIETVKAQGFNDFKIKRNEMAILFLASLFLGSFLKNLEEHNIKSVVDFVQRDEFALFMYKNPKVLIDVIMQVKKEKDPVDYFVSEVKLKMNI